MCEVTPEVQQKHPDKVKAVFVRRFIKAPSTRSGSVAFEGNRVIDDAMLKAAVVVRKKKVLLKVLFSRGRYSETLLRASVNKIVNMYQVMGFPDVRVSTKGSGF